MRIRRAFHHGFSLIEVLLAILILGIGVISIAALFPAGIAQQRLSTDDFMGSIVANHAASIIRAKVRPEDFGTFDDFNPDHPDFPDTSFVRTVRTDWAWMRPSFLFDGGYDGAIDVFSHIYTLDQSTNVASENYSGWGSDLYGIPYNTNRYGSDPPRIIITQHERFYPMQSGLVQNPVDPPRPQYVWECMFRRYNGRIYIAIFVYRVNIPGAAGVGNYVVQQTNGNVPPLPIAIDLGADAWDIDYDNGRPLAEVPGHPISTFNVFAEDQAWQAQRQWILDQNNNTHRVLGNRREGMNMVIELTKPLAPVRLPFFGGYDDAFDTTGNPPNWPTFGPDEYYGNPQGGPNPQGPPLEFPMFDRGVVTRFWYLPLRMDAGGGIEYSLTPVYITVKEL